MTSAVTETPVVEGRTRRWGGGPIARAVARAPVSVRVKLLLSFGVIVGLLVVVAAAGLLALRQSNSRVVTLRTEQQKARLAQDLLANAKLLQSLVQERAALTVAPGTKGVTPRPKVYYSTLDGAIQSVEG